MIADLLKLKERVTHSRPYFVVIKLPLILFAALFGFIMEFVVELPFMVLCLMDRRFNSVQKSGDRDQGRIIDN